MPRFLAPLAFLNFEIPLAVYIAIGLILIAAVVLIVSRLGVLPEKGVRYLAAALLGLFGIAVYREWRSRQLSDKARKLEEQIKQKEDVLKDTLKKAEAAEAKAEATEGEAKAAEEDLRRFQAAAREEQAARQKEALLVKEKNKEEKAKIDALSDDDVFAAFDEAFPPQPGSGE